MPNSWEVELKFEVADEQELIGKLTELGFEQVAVEKHCDTYLQHPCRDFRATDEAFRLRQVDSTAFITYKGKRAASKVKIRPEIELSLCADDIEAWKVMLAHLGFAELPAVRKQRQIFKAAQANSTSISRPAYEDFVVTLDEVEQLGTFAEIELIVVDERQLSEAQQRVTELGDQLGLEHLQPRSYLSQLLEKLGIE